VEDTAVLVRALVLPEEGSQPKLSVQDIVALDNARIDMPGVISIRIWLHRNGEMDRAQALEELFKKKPGGTQVRFRLESPRDFSVLLDVPATVRPDKEFKAAVEAICGSDAIEKLGRARHPRVPHMNVCWKHVQDDPGSGRSRANSQHA
jgi:DNA polymerase-3 subunit alpha